jgi:hypothetical protein
MGGRTGIEPKGCIGYIRTGRETKMLLNCANCRKDFEASARQEKRTRCSKKHQPKLGYACSHGCIVALSIKVRDSGKRLSPRKLAYSRLNGAVRSGEIVRPDRCEKCGECPEPDALGRSRIEGHHLDHSKALDVIWLCDRCHKEETPIARGERSGVSIFKEKDIHRIRRLLDKGKGVKEIGRMYGVLHKTISDIKYGRTWRWLCS